MRIHRFVPFLLLTACSEKPAPPPNVPESLKAPQGEAVTLKALASGVQVYECKDTKWVLAGPDAELKNDRGAKIGRHFKGPTWALDDGSSVVAEVVGKSDAPAPDAVPWLLLKAKSTDGKGALDRVTTIQRVDTSGGKAPADTCTAGGQTKVPYTATYYFYAPDKRN
jgi:hypothetical protein